MFTVRGRVSTTTTNRCTATPAVTTTAPTANCKLPTANCHCHYARFQFSNIRLLLRFNELIKHTQLFNLLTSFVYTKPCGTSLLNRHYTQVHTCAKDVHVLHKSVFMRYSNPFTSARPAVAPSADVITHHCARTTWPMSPRPPDRLLRDAFRHAKWYSGCRHDGACTPHRADLTMLLISRMKLAATYSDAWRLQSGRRS